VARPALLDRLTRLGRRLRRRVLVRRRPLAALSAGLAVAAGLHAVAAPSPHTVPVVVAARDLAAGAPVRAGDVRTAAFRPGSVPAGLVADPVGRTLASPLRAGEPVTDARLLGPALARASPGGVAVPVRLSDPGTAALLRVGDQVDLVSTDPQDGSTTVLASRVLVLALPAETDSDGVAGAAAGGTLTGRVVVLAVPVADVTSVSGASVTHFLTFAWSQ
jgi:Flp pilus assembly protein CpaB